LPGGFFVWRGTGFGLGEERTAPGLFFLRTGLEHGMMSSGFAVETGGVNQVLCQYRKDVRS